MAMEIKLNQRLSPKLGLLCAIEFSELLMVPDEVLSAVVGAVTHNPAKVEATLRKNKKERGNLGSSVRSIYSSTGASEGPHKKGSGLILSPDLRTLEGCITEHEIEITPDATFIGRKNAKPEIVYSDHIVGSMNLLLRLEDLSPYPETSGLIKKIRRFDEWKRRILRNAYVAIGDAQREYFERFDSTAFQVFSQQDLATELGISLSTVSRITTNRMVEARNLAGDKKMLYARELLVTQDEQTRYLIFPLLNEIMEEEFSTGKALSDPKIYAKVSAVARRTISKYRKDAGIPGHFVRNRVYADQSRVESYKFE